MKNPTKYIISTILIAIMTIASMMAYANVAQAQTTPNVSIKNWAYVDLMPSKVGVGQPVNVVFGIDHMSPTASLSENLFKGFSVTITKPDGTTETKSDLFVDSTSFGYFPYTPEKAGNYTFVCNFPGQWVNLTIGDIAFMTLVTTPINYYYEPATSPPTILTVQDEPVPGVPSIPLPTDYWTTPVYSTNKNWAVMLDNWLMPGYDSMPRTFNGLGAFSPYSAGPNSAHILWTSQLQDGGLVGGPYGSKSYYPSEVYEEYYTPMILNGRIYYTVHGPSYSGSTSVDGILGTRVLDLYTGKELFYMQNVTITNIQTLDVEVPNKHGIVPYLWEMPGLGTYSVFPIPPTLTGTWKAYDAFDGHYIFKIDNAISAGYPINGPNGEILVYTLAANGRWLSLWNSTKCETTIPNTQGAGFSIPVGSVFNWQDGIEWNVTLNAPNAIGSPAILSVSLDDSKVLVGYDARLEYPSDQITYPAVFTDCAYPASGLTNGTTVNPSWVANRTNIYDTVEQHYNIVEGMYSWYDDASQRVHTYDVNTGAEISVSPELSPNAGRLYTIFSHSWMAYGNTYVWSYDGHVYCVQGSTGNILWDTYVGDIPYGQAYSTVPFYQGATIADGKVYVGGSDHTPDSDMWVGSNMYCMNASTGEIIWKMNGWYGYSSLSNGLLTAYNGYDVNIYTWGKGPSSMTVTAPSVGVTTATPITITGTIMDVSPGAKQDVVAANFANGLPCVSDESMGDWMAHVYAQQPLPINITGVPIIISVVDSNGNYRQIGQTTTVDGTFAYTWTPDISGNYQVIASFAGSNSYYPASAIGHFYASDAATPAPTTMTLQPFDNTMTIVGIGAAIIIAVIIVGVMLAMMIRKRP